MKQVEKIALVDSLPSLFVTLTVCSEKCVFAYGKLGFFVVVAKKFTS